MEYSWLELTRKDISPVEKWAEQGIVLQRTPLPGGDCIDGLDILRFCEENPILLQIHKGQANPAWDSFWANLIEEVINGERDRCS